MTKKKYFILLHMKHNRFTDETISPECYTRRYALGD